jgi:hypothetical protein
MNKNRVIKWGAITVGVLAATSVVLTLGAYAVFAIMWSMCESC